MRRISKKYFFNSKWDHFLFHSILKNFTKHYEIMQISLKKKKKNEISEILNEIKERYWKSHVIKTKNENIFQYKNN